MSGDDLAIFLFWLTLAAGMGVEAVKAETLSRRIGFGSAAGLFLLLALFWHQLQSRLPGFTASVDSIANNPQTWFVLCVLAYLMVKFWSPKGRTHRVLRERAREARSSEAIVEKETGVEVKALADSLQEVDRKVEVVRLSLPPLERRLKDQNDLLTVLNKQTLEHGQGIETLGAQGKATINGLISLRSNHIATKNHIGLLVDALRARDAESLVKEHDKIAWLLGPKLLRANDYTDQEAWLKDYGIWREHFGAIDTALSSFGVQGVEPFLFVRDTDLQKCAEMPPESIRGDSIIVPYKTVRIVHLRYVPIRPLVLKYFESKGRLPG